MYCLSLVSETRPWLLYLKLDTRSESGTEVWTQIKMFSCVLCATCTHVAVMTAYFSACGLLGMSCSLLRTV